MSSSPYAPAANLLSRVWTTHKSLKTLAYDSKGNLVCSKATYAQVCHVLESQPALDHVVSLFEEGIRNKALLYVLLYELLLGPNLSIRGGGALKRRIMVQEDLLREEMKKYKKIKGRHHQEETVSFPRYVRVNTLQTSVSQVAQTLKSCTTVYADPHVPSLLVLDPSYPIHKHKLVKDGKVVLQDKSSCFSALCLIDSDNIKDGDYLDACAAPGNKTSHLAALVAASSDNKKSTTIYALDRNETRFASLESRMKLLVPSCSNLRVVPQHQDFLQTKASDYKHVKGILLDPSCSGSGIFTSPDRFNNNNNDDPQVNQDRLKSLSNFQTTCLKHAMSSFPQVDRIVYSTCSLYKQENECVVAQIMQQQEFANEWKIVAPPCLHHWKRRGRVVKGLTEPQAQCMVRADRQDNTNGFFVCCFERKETMRATTRVDSKAFDPPEGITFYNGEFERPRNEIDSSASSREPVDESNGERPKEDSGLSKVPVDGANESSKSDKPISKKRAKKLAWKKRQAEQKLQRMQKKKQKQAHGNTES